VEVWEYYVKKPQKLRDLLVTGEIRLEVSEMVVISQTK
jgi:hypothetical protein